MCPSVPSDSFRVAEGDDDAQPVDGAALKDRNQLLCATRRALCADSAREKRRCEAHADERERSVLQKHPARQHR